ncbi:putative phytosulfokines 6 [Durio zibethinus]|uniref:Phytosulfokine n=1 Tax=Durio zibethinus TaxID=66656 RepID=A0A6P5YY21_DURZI|nr:putative phytosulfokines 6 [Durio zibethinus]
MKTMKVKFIGFIITFLLFALLLCFYSASARLLPKKQGENEFKTNGIIQAGLLTDIKEDFSNLMGSEECYEKDEECLKRRMIAEPDMDYIYSQHHKP